MEVFKGGFFEESSFEESELKDSFRHPFKV
jgi:hypothetical protein